MAVLNDVYLRMVLVVFGEIELVQNVEDGIGLVGGWCMELVGIDWSGGGVGNGMLSGVGVGWWWVGRAHSDALWE